MKIVTFILVAISLPAVALALTGVEGTIPGEAPPVETKVNRLSEPLAVDSDKPLFSWVGASRERGDYQTAYRIIVSSTKEKAESGEGDMWDSRKVRSREQSDIQYAGAPLKSAMDYYWKVRTWNSKDIPTGWSEAARFGTGFLAWRDWKGAFIGGKDFQLFRKEFTIDPKRKVTAARLFVGALGVPAAFVNGRPVGNSVLNTADAVIRKTTWYRGHDVTALVRNGVNAIGVMMGPGKLGREYGTLDSMKFIAEMVIAFADGSTETVTSDTTWRATRNGPLVQGELNNDADGEKYDARKWPKGWNEAGFDAANWEDSRAFRVTYNKQGLKAELTPPMKIVDARRPQYVAELFPGIYLVDALKNITGWAQISVDSRPGDKVEMRFAEDITSLWNDYSYSVTANVLCGSGGILFRCADEHNYYYWRLVPGGKILACKTVNGNLLVIKEIPVDLLPRTHYQLRIKAIGSRIETYWNGRLLDTLHDSAFTSGKVGFRVGMGDTVRFRDVRLVHEATGKILLESSGNNPGLWLNNNHIKSSSPDTALANQLEITNSEYVVSMFGNVNGGIDQSSLNVGAFIPDGGGHGAMQHDYYIHSGNGVETWEPFQTIHGFRYIEIRGYKGFNIDNIVIKTVRQAVDEQVGYATSPSSCPTVEGEDGNRGSLSTSHQLLKDLYKASLLSTKSVLQWGVVAGCVGRSERVGWVGEVASQAANYYTDMVAFYKHWLVSMRETQHSDGYIDNLAPRQGERAPAFEEDVPWSTTIVTVTWDTYQATGDKSIIRDQYDAMKRFLDWCVATSNVSKSTGGFEDYTTDKDCWGDWCSELEKGFCCPETRPEGGLFATAFFYQATVRLSSMAKEINKTADSRRFQDLAAKIRTAYNRKYLKHDGQGAYYLGNSQTVNALSVALGLCPNEKTKKEVVQHLVQDLREKDYRLTVGILGLYGLFDALCDNGYINVAYNVATRKAYPSWGYWFKPGGYWLPGATSMWEFWDGHGFLNGVILGGKLNNFLVKNLAGISPLKPGYAEILIKPGVAGELSDMRASAFSPKRQGSNGLDKTRQPQFCHERLNSIQQYGRSAYSDDGKSGEPYCNYRGRFQDLYKGAKKNKESVKFLREEDGYLVFKVGSGSYEFKLSRHGSHN